MTMPADPSRYVELHRRLQTALPELLEAIQEHRPLSAVLLSNGLQPHTLQDLKALGYLENVNHRTGRGARFRWRGPTSREVLADRLPSELTQLHLQRRHPRGRGRYVTATTARTCHRCQQLVERGAVYLITATRHGEQPTCLSCRRPMDLPEHEAALDRLRLQLEHVRHLQPQELTTWRHRLRQVADLLSKRLNVHRHGAPRELHRRLDTLGDWLLGAERIADRHLRALRYRANPSEFVPRDLTSYHRGEVERERPTDPLPPPDQRVELIRAEEFERGLPYTPLVVEQACRQAVLWLRELHDLLDSRHRQLQPPNPPTTR